MSLFQDIRRLCLADKEQIEDILTEVVAEVLRNAPELTLAWLDQIGVNRMEAVDHIHISTQERLDSLVGHATDSKVDMTIRLSGSGKKRVIFVESKVGSTQSSGQLQRYAELLCEVCQREGAEGSLVFIARGFEPVEKPVVQGFSFSFFEARWFRFYQCLKARRSRDGLERQLKHFMKEHNMALGNQFRSVDLVALEHFLGAKALMDETLEGAKPRWQQILGRGGAVSKAMTQLRMHSRYTIFTRLIGFEVLLGYWLPHADSGDLVWAGMTLYCDPKAPDRSAIIQAFRKWSAANQPEWVAEELDNPKEWGSIYKGRNLNTFQTAADQVAELKTYFLGLIQELEEFKNQYQKLPWTPTETSDEEEGQEG